MGDAIGTTQARFWSLGLRAALAYLHLLGTLGWYQAKIERRGARQEEKRTRRRLKGEKKKKMEGLFPTPWSY
jgi:hypothetical protein